MELEGKLINWTPTDSGVWAIATIRLDDGHDIRVEAANLDTVSIGDRVEVLKKTVTTPTLARFPYFEVARSQ